MPLLIRALIVLGLLAQSQLSADAEEETLPSFGEPVKNVTVTRGRDATLVCVTENLANYKVAWVKVDTQTILTIGTHLITRNYQISLTHSDARVWYLRLSGVDRNDTGWYMCQINTDPMISQMGYLEVVEPPDIVLDESSEDMLVSEGAMTALRCVARGYPTPAITWYREGSNQPLVTNSEITVNGTTVEFSPVKRHHMGVYMCVATNGIPPSVSKRVVLQVQFPPRVNVTTHMLSAVQGSTVTLQCRTEAFPRSITYWVVNSDVVSSGAKYNQQEIVHGYKLTMQLKILRVAGMDFTAYKCVAKNPHGEAEATIRVTERQPTPEELEARRMQQYNAELRRQREQQQQSQRQLEEQLQREQLQRRQQQQQQQQRRLQNGSRRPTAPAGDQLPDGSGRRRHDGLGSSDNSFGSADETSSAGTLCIHTLTLIACFVSLPIVFHLK